MACNILRIDLGDGSPVVDYRIERDGVETRTLRAENEKPWQRLTPEQLTSQVMGDTIVAHWLRCRMGIHDCSEHALLIVCNQQSKDSQIELQPEAGCPVSNRKRSRRCAPRNNSKTDHPAFASPPVLLCCFTQWMTQ